MRPGTPGFVGGRLREAREARGLAATNLADLLGVSKQAVSSYESGDKSPAPEVMRKIADTLNLSIHFFLRPESTPDPGVTFFRSKATTSNILKARAERRQNWLREVVGLVRGYVRLPAVNYPRFNPPSDPLLITDTMIRSWATQTRRFWGLGDGPISDVVRLLENNGTIIARHELGSSELDAHSKWSGTDETPYVILGTDKGSAARSRHDVSHELGHLVMHCNVPETTFNQKDKHAILERQVYRFAGEFLMPEDSFSEDFYAPSLDAFRAMKSKWKVSIAAMLYRSVDLKLISEEEGTRLWINLGRRKWRTHEPLDDVLEPEQPKLLERSLKLLSDHQLLTVQDISHTFGFSDADVESIVGLPPGTLTWSDRKLELITIPPKGLASEAEPGDTQTIRFPGRGRTNGNR